MALASLCYEVTNARSRTMSPLYERRGYPRTTASFVAFIVNHRLRDNSGLEAKQVATELERFGIEPHILEMDWRSYGDPSSLNNIETVARRLRYQLLGKACRDKGIRTLLVAHHNNDVAETVLIRILSNYLGAGLGVMRSTVSIPECSGIYGVDSSGNRPLDSDQEARETRKSRRDILIESGGVFVARPLLPFHKAQLVDVCQQNGVQWFEDHTNADPTLTLRNTVRFLNKSRALPLALQTLRLSALSRKVSKRHIDGESEGREIFDALPSTLDLRCGGATFTVKHSPNACNQAQRNTLAIVVRRMIATVTPQKTIALSDIGSATDLIFQADPVNEQPRFDNGISAVQVAGVDIRREHSSELTKHFRYLFHRCIPNKRETKELRTTLYSKQSSSTAAESAWDLWDNRYWIRVSPPQTKSEDNVDVVVRFLTADDLAIMRKSVPERVAKQANKRLAVVKGLVRFTLPVIVARRRSTSQDDSGTAEEMVAMPSLNWSVEGWKRDDGDRSGDCWRWDVRYKNVTQLKRLAQSGILKD